MGLPCGPYRTVTWGMPMASSCTSPVRARRDLAAMRAAYSVGPGGQADGADRRRCRVRHDGRGRGACSGHAGPGRPDRGRGPGRGGDGARAVPPRPAVVYHTSLHVCVLNTAALREAGFADGQPDPPGGAFGRDREGRLDGVIFEGPMFALFERNLRHDLTRMGAGQAARVVQMARQRLYACGSWRRAGITVAGSPHAPVIIADPLLGLRDAMLRRTGDGLGLGPADRPPAGDALRRHTTH